MKTEFLSGLGITDQNVITQILAENGRDIERIKGEREALQTQLQTAQTTLKSFEGVNPTQLQNEVTRLTNELSTKEAEYNRQIADRDFNDLLRTTAAAYNPRDIKAVMPFLDVEKLKASKNQETDIKAALDAVKKDNAYLFQDVNIPRVVSTTPGPNKESDDLKTQANNALRSLLGRE